MLPDITGAGPDLNPLQIWYVATLTILPSQTPTSCHTHFNECYKHSELDCNDLYTVDAKLTRDRLYWLQTIQGLCLEN